jgi:hypothetical protein
MFSYLLSDGVNIYIDNIPQLTLCKIGDANNGGFAVNFHPFVIFCVFESLGNVHGYSILAQK